MDSLQRAQIGNEYDHDAHDGPDHLAEEHGGADYGMYNNLGALA